MSDIDWKSMKTDREARRMRAFPESELPKTLAGRVEWATDMFIGVPIVDDDGNDTGERMPLITKETYLAIVEGRPPFNTVPR